MASRTNGIKLKLYQPRPGDPDIAECHAKALALAEEIAPKILTDQKAGARGRAETAVRKARALKTSVENFAINKARYHKGDHALRPMYVIWTMLNACNFRCGYCDNHQGEHYFDIPDPGRLDTAEGKRLLEVMRTGTAAIYWCGGEPTMRKDLPELLDYACSLGFYPNLINTNGSLISKRLLKGGWEKFLYQMDIIVVSLDGLNLPKLKEVWGVKNPEEVLVNILLLRELNKQVKFKLAVNTVIALDTLEEAEAVLDLANDLDIWFVPVPVNYMHQPNNDLLNNSDYQSLVEKILARKKEGRKIIGSQHLLENLLYCKPYTCYTALKPHVWSNGEICWPCRASVNVEPVNINLLDHDSFDAAYRAGSKLINPNFYHGPAKNQCGGECAWMQNYTTGRYMEGIISPLTSGITSEIYEFAFNPKNW